MQFTIASALLVGAASASVIGYPVAPKNETIPVYFTEVVTALTTYCPLATILTHAGETYTVKSATTLTITNCPCTITHSSSIATPTTTYVAPVVTPVVSKPVYTTPAAPYTYSNATTPVTVPASTPSGTKVTSSGPLLATANAGSNFAAPGAALAGVMGAMAYLL